MRRRSGTHRSAWRRVELTVPAGGVNLRVSELNGDAARLLSCGFGIGIISLKSWGRVPILSKSRTPSDERLYRNRQV